MEPLHVIAVISNPSRYKARYELYKRFQDHVTKSPGCVLHVVEASFGERPHAVSDPAVPTHWQVTTDHELWHKENLLNYGLARLPSDWAYCAWVDADVSFARPDWAVETVHQLQHTPVVQMFSEAHDLGPDFQTVGKHTGFAYAHVHGLGFGSGHYSATRHPGFAWAARREFIDAVGGLLDYAILGSADSMMACGIIGRVEKSLVPGLSPNYVALAEQWQARAVLYGKKSLGYVPGTLLHGWHGAKKHRQYGERWKILVDEAFNPATDLKRDSQGIYQLVVESERQIRLRDKLKRYNATRNEDSIDL